jgi:hypothetical protein
MWKCSNCDQSSTRRWNLETHIKRKHEGVGYPINLDSRDNPPSPTQFPISKYNDYKAKSHRTNYFSGAQIRKPGGSNVLKNSFDFVDDFYESVRKFTVVKDFFSQKSSVNQLSFPWGLVAQGWSFPICHQGGYPHIPLPQGETNIINNIVAFRGYVCKICLKTYINPIFWFDETRKLVEAVHQCQNKPSLNGNLLELIKDLYLKLLLELKDAVNFWTVNNPVLVSEPAPIAQNDSYLSISYSTNSSWLSRSINDGETALNDTDLLDFLLTSGNQTYNCFRLIRESPESDHRYYLLRIIKSKGSSNIEL